MLVGNKCDLAAERKVPLEQVGRDRNETRRDESILQVQDRAAQWQVPFMETSAKDRINVDKVIDLSA